MSAKYYALLTNIGVAKITNAAALGTKLNITEMAVGDGGGELPTPTQEQTTLVNERRRASINQLSIDPVNDSQIIVEQVIPENIGGWWIREVGLFDADGDLVAVSNCAETYKPLLQEGSGRTQTVRMVIIVSNTANVTVKIDPAIVIATREYVDSKVNAHSSFLKTAEGAKSIGFLPIAGELTTVDGYLKDGYILVKSRDELVAAQGYVKDKLKRRTEIRLARDFEPWKAEKTDIDLAWVTITGHADGTYIDATGIPNVNGNYFIRFYNSGEQDIGNLPFLDGLRFSGVNFKGPGRNSLVDGVLFHSPDHQMGSLTIGYFNIQEFRRGISFQTNAYIIKVMNACIARCNMAGVDQPAGFFNYGENIALYGCTIGVSGGPAIHINNGNGGFHVHNCSLDYTGQVIVTEAGYVECHGGHHEFGNSSNPLTDVPYVAINAQTARITLRGTKVVNIRSAGMTQPYLVKTNDAADGVYMFGAQWQNIRTTTGEIKTGDGRFVIRDTQVQNGAGNHGLNIPQSIYENLMVDGSNDADTPLDWYVRRVNNNVASRIQGDNITLSNSNEMPRASTKSLKVTKSTAGTNHGIEFITPVLAAQQPYFRFYVYPISGTTGAIFTESYFVAAQGFDQYGRPNIIKRSASMGIRTTLLTGSVLWQSVYSYPSKTPVPSWATHMLTVVNSSGLGVGGYYIADAGIWQI